ncbi:hypothetical protein WMF04_01105 [Sorangium sp. So ce260]|uniref:hypothetical protein n=1 Tax=Sorangium sp. So ce260 TaxID=3133291 RepID=UPI003F5FDB21
MLRDLASERAEHAAEESRQDAFRQLVHELEKVTINAGGIKAEIESAVGRRPPVRRCTGSGRK